VTSKDTPPDVRREHAGLLASLAEEDPRAAAALLEAAEGAADPSIVARLVGNTPALRGRLFDRLRDERESVRVRALELLSQGPMGPVDTPVLSRCLRDPAASVRARAALALMRGAGPFDRRRNPPEPIVPPAVLVAGLVDALHDAEGGVRVQAAQSLGSLGALGDPVRDALPALAESLSDEPVRLAAANSVGRLVFELKVPALSVLGPAMESPAGATRAAAARALAASGRRAEAVALLKPLLDDPQPSVRVAALQAAATLGPDASSLAPRVDALQSDREQSVAQAARTALGAFRGK
jgi:HEAT repeat protein